MAYKLHFISLGCAKNMVNCEQMMALCRDAGMELCPSPEGCDAAVVNTCGFLSSANEEAIENILAMAELKKAGKLKKILVTGCMTQRYQGEVAKELPEVDGILGTGSYKDIVDAVETVMAGGTVSRFDDINAPVDEFGRVLTTPGHYAFLRIAEGCDNWCAFCIIPKLRGKYRSRTMEHVLAEARQLADSGVKELIVIAQDITRYGMDWDGKPHLADFLEELCKLDFHWIRLHYLYPEWIDDRLIDVIAREDKILKYLDIPLQHCNDKILKKMNRRGDKKYLCALLDKLRERIPASCCARPSSRACPARARRSSTSCAIPCASRSCGARACFPIPPRRGRARRRWSASTPTRRPAVPSGSWTFRARSSTRGTTNARAT